MAFALTSLTAAETAAYAADKPMLVSPNRLLPTHSRKWTAGVHSWAGADDTASAGPVTRLDDDFTHLRSTHNTSGVFTFLLFDFGVTGITFDVVALLNFSCSSRCIFRIYVSDDSAFPSPTNLSDITEPTQVSRHVAILSQRVTVARYASIVLTDPTSSVSTVKSVGEVIFGRRCQLDWRPDAPYDDFSLASPIVRRTTTITGITNTVALGPTGQRRIRATCPIDSAATQANLRSWWTEAGGARPFLWIENPYTAPNRACLMHQREPAFSFPYTDALNREFVLDAEEQGPNYVSLET